MSVSLLTNTVIMPYSRKSFEYWERVGTVILIDVYYELTVSALVAVHLLVSIFLAPTLFLMCLGQAVLMEWHGVCQALHHCVKETSISMVLHAVSHPW